MHSLKIVSRLNYRMFGIGRPVVFLHGFLESLTMWEYLDLDSLGVKCICIDLPGHGESDLLDDAVPSMNYFASEVHALLQELNIETYSIVGHSMGGYVGLQLMQLSGSIDKLVLLNSTYWADSELKKRDRILVAELVQHSKSLFLKTAIPNLFLDPKKYHEAVASLIKEAEEQSSGAIAYASLAMRNRTNFTGFTLSNTDKIVLIQGQEDKIVPMALIEETSKGKLTVYPIEHCGHMAHIEKSAEVIRALSVILQ